MRSYNPLLITSEPGLDRLGVLQFHFRASTPFSHKTIQRLWKQCNTCEIGPFSRNGTRQLGFGLLSAEIFFPLCYFCIFVFTLLNLFFPLFLLPLCVYFYFYLQGLLFFEIPNSFGNMFLAQGRWSICVKCYIPVTGCSS